ncbi:Not available [Clostridium perfringens]|nr:Not available [Clostridium perfringens]
MPKILLQKIIPTENDAISLFLIEVFLRKFDIPLKVFVIFFIIFLTP